MFASSNVASLPTKRADVEYLLLLEEKARRQSKTLRTDRAKFFSVTQGFDPDPIQKKILTCEEKYVQLLICRQWGKSTTAAVLAAHVAIYEPGSLILIVARGDRQAKELFDKVARTCGAAPGAPRRTTDSAREIVLDNGSRIVCLPGSAETIVGYSAPRLVIIDEAARTKDDVYTSVRPMLSRSPNGQLVLLSTAYGKRGFFYKTWQKKSPAWAKFGPIKGSQVHDAAFLAEEQRSMPAYWFRQEYDCEFVEEVDSVFSHETIERALANDVRPLFGRRAA